MNRIEIEMPDGTIIDAPETATKEQILSKYRSMRMAELAASNPGEYDPNSDEFREKYGAASGNNFLQNARIGWGKAVTDFGRGVSQLFGAVSTEDVQASRDIDQDINRTGGGKVGQILGGISVGVPALAIPGANTVAGAGMIGAGYGFLQPVVSNEERLKNTAIGAAAGSAGQYLGGKVATWAANRKASKIAAAELQQSQNVVRDATLAEARKAGYVVPPSTVRPSVGNRLAESISGKAATAQAAAVKNQQVTNSLARKALGLGEKVPLTRGVLNAVRSKAGNSYKAISETGEILTDNQYIDDLSDIVGGIDDVAKDFPELNLSANQEISKLVDSLLKDKFSAGSAIEAIKQLRKSASGNLSGASAADPSKRALGAAQRDAAGVIEDQIIRHLGKIGKADLAKDFDSARTLIAKTYSVEAALNEGTGNVVAANLVAQLKRKKPLSGELELIAKFGQAFRKATQEITDSPGVSALDALIGIGGGGVINPALAAYPVVRAGARASVLSGAAQRTMAAPRYNPSTKTLSLIQDVGRISAVPAVIPSVVNSAQQ